MKHSIIALVLIGLASCNSYNNSIKMTALKKTNITLIGGDKWEEGYGFSRAKVIENKVTDMKQVFISNTSTWGKTSEIQGKGDVEAQVEQIIKNMEKAMLRADGSLDDIVETIFYITDFGQFEVIAKVHKKYFGDNRQATTLIQVPGIVSEEILVEGSARAIIAD